MILQYACLLLCVFLCSCTEAQTLQVQYRYQIQPVEGTPPAATPQLAERRRLRYEHYVMFTLTQVDKRSTFSRSSNELQEGIKDESMIGNYHHDRYDKDFGSKEFRADITYLMKHFLVADSLHQMQWTLDDEQRTILGYNCYKATLTSPCEDPSWEAWYSPEIPISNGPLEYGGLPGLILHLRRENGSQHLLATNLVLTNDRDTPISIMDGKKAVNYEQWCEEKQKIIIQLERMSKIERKN